MKYQKVVWYEGMKLDPHHFQESDRYIQYSISSRFRSLNPNFWGISEMNIDSAALAGGSFGFVQCRGLMPDGFSFNMPENDPLPKSRKFEDLFDPTSERLDVFLALPIEHPAGSNIQINGDANQSNSRFILQNVDMTDYNTGTNMRAVGVAKPNFQLRFGDESIEDFDTIKIGEIVRSSDGRFTMDKNYVPPSLSVSNSEVLQDMARKLLGSLVSKSKELRSQTSVHKPELTLIQVEILLMLQTINSFIPLLNYYYSSQNTHPENLYVLLLNLAGQLSTYTNMGIKTAEFPVYDHKHLSEVFNQVITEINTMLNVQKTVERRDIIVPLRKQADTLYIGQLSPNQISSLFFLAVQGEIPEKKIIAELPKNIKISAYEEIFAVHQAGIQGVTIEYVARPPVGITINEQAHYFKINKEGRFWDKIAAKNNIAFFIASEFKTLQMELVLLLPGD
jgi:type VI secretion system protein ImpJ